MSHITISLILVLVFKKIMKGVSSLGIKLRAKKGGRRDRVEEGCMQLKPSL